MNVVTYYAIYETFYPKYERNTETKPNVEIMSGKNDF